MSAARIVVIGNRGGGKSTLSRRLAARRRLTHIEIDTWLEHAAADEAEHTQLIAQDSWLIDGLGHQASIPARLARATEIVLVDLPLWMHAALVGNSFTWNAPNIGKAERGLWQTIEAIERELMPEIRRLCGEAERCGARVVRLESAAALERFALEL